MLCLLTSGATTKDCFSWAHSIREHSTAYAVLEYYVGGNAIVGKLTKRDPQRADSWLTLLLKALVASAFYTCKGALHGTLHALTTTGFCKATISTRLKYTIPVEGEVRTTQVTPDVHGVDAACCKSIHHAETIRMRGGSNHSNQGTKKKKRKSPSDREYLLIMDPKQVQFCKIL